MTCSPSAFPLLGGASNNEPDPCRFRRWGRCCLEKSLYLQCMTEQEPKFAVFIEHLCHKQIMTHWQFLSGGPPAHKCTFKGNTKNCLVSVGISPIREASGIKQWTWPFPFKTIDRCCLRRRPPETNVSTQSCAECDEGQFFSGLLLVWIQSFLSHWSTKNREPSLSYSLLGKKRWIHGLPKRISMKWSTNSFIQDLNSAWHVHFLTW